MRTLAILLIALLTTGCATKQYPISMQEDFLTSGDKVVGIVLTRMPEPDVYLPGADCLLCIATAEATNASLSKHTKTLQPDDFKLIKSELVQQIQAQGVKTVVIDKFIDPKDLPKSKYKGEGIPERDYREFSDKYGISHLLVIDIDRIGFIRNYQSYVPTNDPRAILEGTSYLVDLEYNHYKWYKPIKVEKAAVGNWKEKPDYPALTEAYFEALAIGREMIVSEFR